MILRQVQHDKVEIVVSNLLGVQMMRLPRVDYNARNDRFQETTIDISNLTSGIYFIRVHNSNGSEVSKFVKQ